MEEEKILHPRDLMLRRNHTLVNKAHGKDGKPNFTQWSVVQSLKPKKVKISNYVPPLIFLAIIRQKNENEF